MALPRRHGGGEVNACGERKLSVGPSDALVRIVYRCATVGETSLGIAPLCIFLLESYHVRVGENVVILMRSTPENEARRS